MPKEKSDDYKFSGGDWASHSLFRAFWSVFLIFLRLYRIAPVRALSRTQQSTPIPQAELFSTDQPIRVLNYFSRFLSPLPSFPNSTCASHLCPLLNRRRAPRAAAPTSARVATEKICDKTDNVRVTTLVCNA